MKKNILLKAILFAAFMPLAAFSQVTNVCGTDTVVLRVNNYQYGTMQWEESTDSSNWVSIQGANDTVYKFFPTEIKYYRAVVKFAECPPEYSEVTLVQLPPKANAGTDRIVPGNTVTMLANAEPNALGAWSIISGNGGSFTNNNDPYSDFQGSDSLYTLVWSLSNTCGTSNDTIHTQFIQNQYISYIAIVDSTDNIISDSAQMASGLYVIHFSNPVPTINDSTVLLGLVNDGFIRRVDSFYVQNDTITMYTSQGTLEDITISGAYDLAQVFGIDTSLTNKSGGLQRLNHMPTRKELTTNPKYKTGNYYYIVEDKPVYTYPGVKLNRNNTKGGGSLIDLNFNSTLFTIPNASLKLTGNYKFNPNLISDIDYSGSKINAFRMGMYNGTIRRNYKLSLTASASASLLNQSFTLLSLKKDIIFVIGGVPVWIKAQFNIDGKVSADVAAGMNISHEYTKTSTYTAAIEYKNGTWSYPFAKSDNVQTNNSFAVSGDLSQAFDVGPNITFKIYGIVGPYIDTRLTENFNLCLYNTNWQANLNLGGELTIGARAKALGTTLFDVKKTWSHGFYHLQLPYRLEMIAGNNQMYNQGSPLANSVKVKVTSNKGFAVPGAIVHFSPKDGGSVQNSIVTTDASGMAETSWTPGGTTDSKLEAYVLDCNGNNISNSPLIFYAYINTNCSQSSLTATIIVNGSTISPRAQMGAPPYTYSTDGTNYTSQIPQIIPTAGQTYNFYVKDSIACIATTSYTAAGDSCINSGLAINLLVMGKTIEASAQNGTPPYLFSLDNASGGFTANPVFQNVSTGSHTVYVKDSNGCIDAENAMIYTITYGTVSDYDGNVYKTVKIGNQWWMAENLKTTHYNNGAAIPLITNSAIWDTLTTPGYCWYNNNIGYKNPYGALYNWYTVETGKLCPVGWHVPSDAEWTTLSDYLGDASIAGGKLKETGTTHWNSPNYGATNETGFSGLPGGYRTYHGAFDYIGGGGYWWSSTEYSSATAWLRYLTYYSSYLTRYGTSTRVGRSVRCLRD